MSSDPGPPRFQKANDSSFKFVLFFILLAFFVMGMIVAAILGWGK